MKITLNNLAIAKNTYQKRWKEATRIKSSLARCLLAEFFSTALLRFIGTGGMVGYVVGSYNILHVNIIWGLAITSAVYPSYLITGGHVNPAITAIIYFHGYVSFFHAILYMIVQILGAMLGAALSYANHREIILFYGNGTLSAVGEPTSTGNIFASFPGEHLSNSGAFVDQMIGTGLLGVFIGFFCEKKNKISTVMQPLLYGLVATMISISYGINMGAPVNPATDFGSRSFAAMVGYGSEMFSAYDYFFWIPIVGPMVGGILGAAIYRIFIGHHLPDE
uniref:Aquaporin n=1 Tax=Syphacia muris TaxID=451379 RepID=A0A0N5AHS1_9BILA